MEGRLEGSERFEGCVGTGAFVHLENDFSALGLAAIRSGEAHRSRNDLLIELARLDGCDGLLVAVDRELVGLLTGNAALDGKALGGEAHREVRVGIVLNQPGVRE